MKYKNKKTQVDMYVFDSIAESRRYKELALLERVGKIKDLQLQPRFLLQESFRKNGTAVFKKFYCLFFCLCFIEGVRELGT